MSSELEAQATVERLRALRRADVLDERAHLRALELTIGAPSSQQWRTFISRASLVLGASLVLAAVVYFFAYNWHALHKVVKFAVLEGGVAGAALASLRLKALPTQVALLFAAVLLGPLLAMYGQTYQTGADPWTLFAVWALLAVPFALSARWAPLWALVVAVANVALLLAYQDFGWWHEEWQLLAQASLNLCAWGMVEMLGRRLDGARGRWFPRLLAAATVLPVTLLGMMRIVERTSWWNTEAGTAAVLTGLVLVAGIVALYRRALPDLFMLSLATVVVLTFGTSLCARWLMDHLESFEAGWILLSGLLVAEVAFAVVCLKRARLAFALEAA